MRPRLPCLMPFAFALWLVGCGGASPLIRGDAQLVLDGTLQLQPQIDWSRSRSGWIETWTVDGEVLNELVFVKGASDGDPLVAAKPEEDLGGDMPAFDRAMTAIEVHDLYVATLSRLGHSRIATWNIGPWQVGSYPGFRFAFSHEAEDGLQRKGLAAGFLRDGELWLVTYTAPSVHYFQKYRPQVEALLSSMRLL